MTATLVKFGFVMLVVMMGFAMAIHVLLRDIDSSGTFGETMLALFKAMLGDTDLFDEFSGERYDDVATVLVVMYVLIMTIMLLNLLVAILSTAHAQVQDNVGGEFRVSKARIIEYYRLVVDKDLLPAPFNLMQIVAYTRNAAVTYFSEHWCQTCSRTTCHPSETEGENETNSGRAIGNVPPRTRYGEIVFSLVLGSVAVVVGAILWVGSALPIFPYAQYAYYAQHMETIHKKSGRDKKLKRWVILWKWVLISLWCYLGAPLALLALWSQAFIRLAHPCAREKTVKEYEEEFESGGRATNHTIDRLLRMGPGGVGTDELRKFLEDPMDDKDVRQDERARLATVEHIKLLRNRLENSRKRELIQLTTDMNDSINKLRNDITATILDDKRREKRETKHELAKATSC